MKDRATKNKRSSAVLALTLLILASGSLAVLSDITWKIEALSDANLLICSEDSLAQQLREAVASSSQISEGHILVAFFPTVANRCAQMDTSHTSLFSSNPGTFYLTKSIEENVASDPAGTPGPVLNSSVSYQNSGGWTSNSGQDFGTVVEQAVSGITVPKGMAIFMYRVGYDFRDFRNINHGEAYYYVKSYGGWFDCHASCETCSSELSSGCTSCKSWSSREGAQIDPQLDGYCFCPEGDVNQGGTGCDTSACHSSCKNCQGPTESDCIECADGFTPNQASFPRKCESGGGASCHETCQTCDQTGKCLVCKTAAGGPLSPLNNECRCPAGKYFVTGENRCASCDASCHSCAGPGSDQCLTCSNFGSVVNKAASSNAGTCVECANPARSSAPECSGTTFATLEMSSNPENTPTTVESLTLYNFVVAKVPIRIPHRGKHIISLKADSALVTRVKQLGSQFVASEFVKATITGLTTPADFTFTGAANEAQSTIDLTFTFTKDHGSVEVLLEVNQNNYFINNIPNLSATRRRGGSYRPTPPPTRGSSTRPHSSRPAPPGPTLRP